MNELSHIELWDKCRLLIKDNIPADQYDVWFKDVTSVQFENDILILFVPSSFFVEQLEERYMSVMAPALCRVYGKNVQLAYRYYQVNGISDTAVTQKSEKPSATIQKGVKSEAANPFKAQPQSDIDSQLNPRYNFDNYCTGESNKVAVAIGRSIADQPNNHTFNPLFVFGPCGVGKTHLIQAIGIRFKERTPSSRVLYVTSRLFESQYTAAVMSKDSNALNNFFHFYQSIDTLIVDDVQDLQGKAKTQNTFFHIFNHLHQNNKQIILSSDCAPAEMDGFESRLLSRFKWGMSAELGFPDIDLRRKVLMRKAEQNGLSIPDEVIEYIANSVTTSIRELEGIVVSLITHATVMNCDITIDLARSVLEHVVKVSRRPVNFEVIAEEVCSFYNIDTDLLFTQTRRREVSDARQLVMYLAKTMAKMPLVAIGHRLDRTHATVNHACKTIQGRLGVDKQLQADIAHIKSAITGC